MRNKWVMAAAMTVLLPLAALAQANGYYERSYTRMSFVQGDVYVQRAQNQGFEQGQVNLVVVEGDKLGTKTGRLEIQLGLSNYLRLDQGAQVEMAGLPDSEGQPTKFHVLVGSAFVRVAAMDVAKNFEIHTPDASFYVLSEGLYRVDVRSGETVLSVLEGSAEGAGQSGSIVIEAGQSVSAVDGSFASEPVSLMARRDDFSAWNDTRDALFASRTTRTTSYLPAEYADYEYELDSYGSWVDEADYGYVWVPRGMGADWRPYSNGRWVWYPVIGWTWVSYDPWGWSTYHYGRWGWGANLGWYWIPRHHLGWNWGYGWGPAWVDWWWNGDYYGWCPLSYWNRPGYIWNNMFYGRYDRNNHRDYRGFDRTMTMIRRDQIHSRNVRDAAVRFDRMGGRMASLEFRGSQPGFERTGRGDSVMNARAAEAFSGRGARSVERGFAGNGTRLSAGEIRSSSTRGREAVSGIGSRSLREGGSIRSGGNSQAVTGRIRQGDANGSLRSGSAPRIGAGEARSIRSYPSQGSRSAAGSTPSIRRNDSAASGAVRSYPSTGNSSSRMSSGSVRTGRDSASRASGSSMREFPSSSSARSYAAPSSSRSSSTRSSSGTLNRSSAREYPSSSSTRSYSAPSSSRSSSSYSNRSTASPSRSYSAPSRSSSSSARSYSAPSSSRSSSSYSNRSTSSPSRSYSAPSRSSSSSARSYSAPSSSRSSSSRSSGGASSRGSSSGSSRSSGGATRRR